MTEQVVENKTYHLAFEDEYLEIMIYSWVEGTNVLFQTQVVSKPGLPDFHLSTVAPSLKEARTVSVIAYYSYLGGLGVPMTQFTKGLPTNTTPKEI